MMTQFDLFDGALIPYTYGQVTYSSGVVANSSQRAFAQNLDKLVPFDVHVTSGTRTPARQASAIAYKRKNEGDAAVRRLYQQKALIDAILARSKSDTAGMAKVIQSQVNRGLFLSRHLRADAIDIRTRDRSKAQVAQLVAAAKKLDARPTIEVDHLHVGRVGSGADKILSAMTAQGGTSGAAYAARRIPWWAWVGGGTVATIALLALGRRRRRRSSHPYD